MNLPISARLLACAGFVAPGERVADIGCDHGYLGIYLLKKSIASSVIASDLRPGPLQSAVVNAAKYGVGEKMSFHLSDGAASIPRDFDCMVCAGMGADTIISILVRAPWLKSKQYRLILQCQSKAPMLRRYLSENGWRITEESVAKDGKFLYTVMEVCYQPDYPKLQTHEWYFPPAILENPSEYVPAYFQYVVRGLQIAIEGQGDAVDPVKPIALAGLRALAKNPALAWLETTGTAHRPFPAEEAAK